MSNVALESELAAVLETVTRDVLGTMVNLEPLEVRQEPSTDGVSAEFLATLGFTGTRSGLVALAAPRALARQISANMMMMDESELSDDGMTADSFGEITNMVAGGFKNHWITTGNRMDLSVPSVARGDCVRLTLSKDPKSQVTVCRLSLQFVTGTLLVQLQLHD